MILSIGAAMRMAFVPVPAGEFLMGSSEDDYLAFADERPQETLWLAGFAMGQYPVTVAQFAVFLNATDYKCEAEKDVVGKGDFPVSGVGRRDAAAFCRWAAQVAGRPIRLPSEAEWEKAARGSDGRLYPWGNQRPDSTHCNIGLHMRGTTIPGRYSPLGDSPYGCADMAGNVWQWTSSLYRPYPYRADDGREDAATWGRRVLRGGCWYDHGRLVRSANRGSFNPTPWLDGIGFRCALALG